MKNISVFLLSYILFLHIDILGQSTTGNIEGWIFDNNKQPVKSANVVLISDDMQGSRGAATDDKGYFRIQALPVGIYTVKISHISYSQVTQNNVHIFLGQTTSLGEIHLKQKIIETEEIQVSDKRIFIDTRSAANDKNLSANEFAQLPIERNYFHVAELLPNANQSYKGEGTNFAGATGIENRYFVDGSEVTTPETGLLRFELPYNFVRQVGIQTGSYQAEYQSALGGIINTVTYSGGNEFHGTIFSFFTNNDFSGSPRLSPGQPPQGNYSNYDIGFGFGGPLLIDRLWYYFAYDPDFTSEDVFVNGLGMQPSHFTKHKFAGKLTWSVNKDNFITIAASGNPYTGRQVYTSPNLTVLDPEYSLRDVTNSVVNISLNGIHNLSDNFMLESSLSTFLMNAALNSVSAKGREPSFNDYVSGTASGGQGFSEMHPAQRIFNFSVKGTLALNSHIIKAGAGYSRESSTNDINWQLIERWPDYYRQIDEKIVGTVKTDNFSTFIQDSWQINRRLCLNAGVRWDPQWLIASDGTVAQKILDQVQPRIGIIYQPAESGTQKISASFGRFYEPLLLSLSALYHIKGAIWSGTLYPNDPRIDTTGAFYLGNFAGFVTNVPDVKGQYFDEYTVGYERLISNEFKIGIRGIYRRLGQGIEDGVVSEADQIKYQSLQIYGNPGSGALSMLPKMKREYKALELTLEHFTPSGFNFILAYVLSRNWGNYDGFAGTYDVAGSADIFPNNTNQFGLPERMINSEGLLPNDRTHVFKFSGSYVFDFGLTAGMIFQWMSGTPLNELGKDAVFGASTFLLPRGTAGRTPSIWDLNFRFQYDFSNLIAFGRSTKVILDILHFASRRKEIDYYQYHYYDYDQQYVDPNYMVPVQFQPPMSFRLGLEVNI